MRFTVLNSEVLHIADCTAAAARGAGPVGTDLEKESPDHLLRLYYIHIS